MDEDLWTAVRTDVLTGVVEKAEEALARHNMTANDAITILLERISKGGAMPFSLTAEEEHDCWVRAMVQEALDDSLPDIPSDEAEVYFDRLKTARMPVAS